MKMKDRFTKQEWQELLSVPFQVFFLVADADGVIDEKELFEMSKQLEDAPNFRDPLHSEILMDISAEVEGVGDAANRATQNLHQVKAILEAKLSENERLHFIKSMFLAGVRVANASGGGFLGLGDKMCKDEKVALATFVMAYGYTLDDMV